MRRLLNIEWIKIRHYRPFWVLTFMYFFSLLLIFSGAWLFLMWLESQGADFRDIKPTMLPIYDFYDIWHNFTFVASVIKVIPAFVFLIMVTNEYSYKTMRQNIIDGMTRREYLNGKLLLAIGYAWVSMLFIFLSALIIGLIFSPVTDFRSIYLHADFLIGHFIELVVYFSFAMFIGILIRRTGFAIVLLFIYTAIIEPVLTAWIGYKFDGPEIFFPVKAINNLVPNSLSKYILFETAGHISFASVAIALVWGLIFYASSYLLLRKRDLL